MPFAIFSLFISEHQTKTFYAAQNNRVRVVTDNGQTMSLPWEVFKPFVTRDGISGKFAVYFDAHGKFKQLKRLE